MATTSGLLAAGCGARLGQAIPVLSGFAFAVYTACTSAALLRWLAAASAWQEGGGGSLSTISRSYQMATWSLIPTGGWEIPWLHHRSVFIKRV